MKGQLPACILFDLDGTLVDSLPGIEFSVREAFIQCELPLKKKVCENWLDRQSGQFFPGRVTFRTKAAWMCSRAHSALVMTPKVGEKQRVFPMLTESCGECANAAIVYLLFPTSRGMLL